MEPGMLRQVVEEFIPFNRFLGIRCLHVERGRVTLGLPFRHELVGDPMKPALHGGVLSALADTAGGMAVWSAVENAAARVSTIDLRVDYLRPGRLEEVVAVGAIVRVGRTVGVADVEVRHPGLDHRIIATAKGVYAIKVPRKSEDPA